MTITDAYGKQIIRVVRGTLRRYATHPQWEDIVAFGILRACEALVALPEQDPEHALGVVALQARWSVQRFFESHQCDLSARWHHRGHALPQFINIGTIEDEHPAWWKRVEPDFAPALIEALFLEEYAREAAGQMTAREAEILWRWLAGETRAQIAHSLGYGNTWVDDQCNRALNRVRRRLGLTEHLTGRHQPDYNERRRLKRANETPEQRAARRQKVRESPSRQRGKRD